MDFFITYMVQKLQHAGLGFRNCIRVRRTCGHARIQLNSSSEAHFLHPPCALVGLMVKHVIKL
ncbi:hypothetical protein Hanom_Chr08g00734811 [Helianthus anomalus]